MRSITKIFALSAPVALLCAACGGSDTYVQPQPQPQPQPAVVVQPAATPAPPPTTKIEVEHD
jgi:hypothetical protein